MQSASLFLPAMSVFDDKPSDPQDESKVKLSGMLDSKTEGFDWPLDHWYIERILYMYSGIMNVVGVFLSFLFANPVFLLIPMTIGVLQAVFAMTGFSIAVKVLLALGFHQRQA